MEKINSKYDKYRYNIKIHFDCLDDSGKQEVKDKIRTELKLNSDRIFYLFLSNEKENDFPIKKEMLRNYYKDIIVGIVKSKLKEQKKSTRKRLAS